MSLKFRDIARKVSQITGSSTAFLVALLVVIIWACFGPIFDYSDTWQLVINTGTTILTFLMVFLIQNTQNRDAKAMHLKLDELIKAVRGARNSMVDLEEMSDEELEKLEKQFHTLAHRATSARERRQEAKQPIVPGTQS